MDRNPLPLLVVDAANVVGSVPDGWWRDRRGANERLRDALIPLHTNGLPSLGAPLEVVLVVEGAARGVTEVEGVRVLAAPGSGDDAIVDLVRAEAPGRRCAVVTADRALRARVTALGAEVLGPRSVR
ncbi:NTP pyrophosphohydrolase [Allokutzneria oryzae]|uniref:NTP pyrophosphohydrolase n=1 Tax=Allokutzneria oryzae TaxID=1378989 RepID=A0ABV6A2Y1_9PSEU